MISLFKELFILAWNIFALFLMIILLPIGMFMGMSFDILFKDACKFPKDSEG